MKRKIKQLFRNLDEFKETEVTVYGWVRTNRSQAQFGFLNINDGSFFENLQVVYDNTLNNFDEISKFTTGKIIKYKANGNHFDLLKQDFAEKNAKVIQEVFEDTEEKDE